MRNPAFPAGEGRRDCHFALTQQDRQALEATTGHWRGVSPREVQGFLSSRPGLTGFATKQTLFYELEDSSERREVKAEVR